MRHLDNAELTGFASSRDGQIKTNEPKQTARNHSKGWKRPLRLSPTIYPALPGPTLNHVPKQQSYMFLGTLPACYSVISRTAKSEKTNAGTELHVPKTGRTTYFISYPSRITLNSTAVDLVRDDIFIAKHLLSYAEVSLIRKIHIIISNHNSIMSINLSSIYQNNLHPDELMYNIRVNTIFMLFLLLLSAQ